MKAKKTKSRFLGMSVCAHTQGMRAYPSCMHTHPKTNPETQNKKQSKIRKLTTYQAYNTNTEETQANTNISKYLKKEKKKKTKTKESEEPKLEPLPQHKNSLELDLIVPFSQSNQ